MVVDGYGIEVQQLFGESLVGAAELLGEGAVEALDLAVLPRAVWADELVSDVVLVEEFA